MALRVVFGIGNPGPRYAGTRHNLGFEVIDALARGARRPYQPIKGLDALGVRASLADQPALLVKPLTFVNRCGRVLEEICRQAKVPPSGLLVVLDDLNLPLGALRLRLRGSHGGHNGLRSLIAHLGREDFPRLRIGIGGPAGRPAERFVLEPFSPEERQIVDRALARAADGVRLWARLGGQGAMARINRRDLDPPGDGP